MSDDQPIETGEADARPYTAPPVQAAPPDPVVCILVVPAQWGPIWAFVHPDPDKVVELLLIDGAPAYPVHGLLASVRVHASGATSPADLSAFGGDHDRRGH